MRKQIKHLTGLGVFIVLVGSQFATTACTGSGGSPTAPADTVTAVPSTASTTAPAATGATISGTVAGLASAASISWRPLSTSGVTVTVAGTTVSSGVDGNGTFTLTGVPPIDVVLNFSGPGVNATLRLGVMADNDHLEINVTIGGTTATLDGRQNTSADQKVDAEGIIDNVDAGGRTFTINGRGVRVPTSAVIRRGDASIGFDDLRRGDRVHVKGVKDGSTILASEVIAQNQTSIPPPEPPATITLSGVIIGIGGVCPALTMKVGDTYVATNSATTFSGKGCSDLKAGDTVAVVATKSNTGPTVLATRIAVTASATPPPPTAVTLSGVIVGVGGTCPALTMKVGDTYVRTTSATTFTGKSCGDFKAGDTVGVVGQKSDNIVTATTLSASH